MSSPGAISATVGPKLLKLANVSSGSLNDPAGPLPPGRPSVSQCAATQMACGAEAGEKVPASTEELPAATHMTTPRLAQAVTALLRAKLTPLPPRLILQTLILLALAAT